MQKITLKCIHTIVDNDIGTFRKQRNYLLTAFNLPCFWKFGERQGIFQLALKLDNGKYDLSIVGYVLSEKKIIYKA